MRTSRVVASVRVVPIYTCRKCGRAATGGTQTFDFDVTHISDVADAIHGARLSPYHMPVGWCSDWSPLCTVFTCEECLK